MSTSPLRTCNLCRPCECSHSHCSPSVSVLLCLEGHLSLESSITSDSYFITLLLPLPPGSLSAESRDLMETSHLRLNVPKSVPVCTQSSCGSLYFFPWLQKEASPKMAEQGTDLWIYQSILNAILLLCSYSRATEFGFPLGPWPIQSLVLGYLSSVRHGRNTNLTTWKNTVCLPFYFARYTFFIITGL